MPTHFIHLENALKRANEFIEVNNKRRALEILCDVLHSKKHRTWQKKHEEIMMKYLALCVELKESYVAKEGLFQYKIICQASYISSFEEAIRKYIELAEHRTNEAKEQSQANISEIDDLENVQTPEDFLMSAVSVEGSQDRKDRVVLIPWVKFLWESYRQCLDMLKNNSKTERLYHDIAQQAFSFCIRYNRKTEFRKLCDYLHLHLDQLKRQQLLSPQPQNAINLSSPDSQALQLETRLRQLDHAIQLELWQEAYKAADDIRKFNLMNLTKKSLGKPQLIANYYQKLALVFWKANSNLFHATALFRLFHLSRELRKNITQEDIQKMASRLVLATLSIPIPPIRPEIDKLVDTEENVIDQHHRNLSSLLGITSKPPTRLSLIKDLRRTGVLQFASQPMQDLFQLLENDFNPLGICSRVQQIIDYIEKSTVDHEKGSELPEMLQYIPSLKEVTIVRLIREVAQVYRTIEFDRLAELCPFVESVYMEKMVVESARRHDLQVRIDHRRGCYVFGTELRVSTGEEYIEGPYLQSMPNEQMRRQLVSMYSSLQKALHLIEPEQIKQQREEMKRQIMKTYHIHAVEEHHRILSRQLLIEQRREMMEQMGMRREADERKRLEEEEAKRREAEKLRLLEETKERERLKREQEEQEFRKQVNMDQLKKYKDLAEFQNLNDDELARLRPEDFHQKRVQQLEKERREQLAKQRKLERKIDHFERAKRVEEIPLLKEQYEEWRIQDQDIWAQTQELRIQVLKEERELALKERERFIRVLDDKKEFERRVLDGRREEFEEKLRKFDRIVEEERKKRLEARRQKRIEERRVAYHKEMEVKRAALKAQQIAEQKQRAFAEIEKRLRESAETAAAAPKPVPPPIAAATIAPRKPEEPSNEPNDWRSRKDPIDLPRPVKPSFQDRSVPPPQLRREQPPPSAADSIGDWRRGGPPPEIEKKPMPPPGGLRDSRSNYGGRFSEGRPRDAPDSRPMQPRAPYSGRDSDSSVRRGERRDGPPPSSRDAPRGGFSRGPPPPMGAGRAPPSMGDSGGSWRSRPAEPPIGSSPNHLDQQPPPPMDDDEGWEKVSHHRRGPERRPGGPPMGPGGFDSRPRYGGRDSRDRDERMASRPGPPPLSTRR